MPPYQKVSPFATKNGGSIQQHLALLILPIINGVRTDNRTNKMSLLSLLSSVVSVQFLLSPSKNKSRRYGTHQFERHFVFQFIGSQYSDSRTQKKKNYHQLDIPFSFLESPRGKFFGEKQQKDSINANVWQFSFSLLGLYEYVMLYFSWQHSLYSTKGWRDVGFFLLCINICRITDDQAYSIVYLLTLVCRKNNYNTWQVHSTGFQPTLILVSPHTIYSAISVTHTHSLRVF